MSHTVWPYNLPPCISKWRSWRQFSDARCLEVMRGHPRSKIFKNVKLQTSMKHDKSYIKMMLLTFFSKKRSREDTRSHLRSQISTKSQVSIFFFKIRQIIPQNEASELIFSKKNSLEVIRGQNFKKIVKLRKFPKKGQLYFKMSLLKSAFHKYIKALPKKFKKIKKSPIPILFSIFCGIQNLYDLFVRRLPDWDFLKLFQWILVNSIK